jgi:hypothetical protein
MSVEADLLKIVSYLMFLASILQFNKQFVVIHESKYNYVKCEYVLLAWELLQARPSSVIFCPIRRDADWT